MSKRQNKLTHVRTYLERLVEVLQIMQDDDGKYEGGLRLSPIDRKTVVEFKLIGKAILHKHKSRGTRKDVYVERS